MNDDGIFWNGRFDFQFGLEGSVRFLINNLASDGHYFDKCFGQERRLGATSKKFKLARAELTAFRPA